MCTAPAADVLRTFLETTGHPDFRLPDMTNMVADRVIVTGIPETREALTGLIGAFDIGLVVTLTSLPLVIPGQPETAKYATSFPSAAYHAVAREGDGVPFYEACMHAMSSGVRFLHLPTRDMDMVPLAHMTTLQQSAHDALIRGKGVWLQCYYGHYRSWSAATFVLQRCGPEPRPLDPMPFLAHLKDKYGADVLQDADYVSRQFLTSGPFARVRRPFGRWDADARDVLWLLATHPEASAFIMAAAASEASSAPHPHWLPELLILRARESTNVKLEDLLRFKYRGVEEAKRYYDMEWLDRMCALTKATLQPLDHSPAS